MHLLLEKHPSEHRIWRGMISRCLNRQVFYEHVSVCERWAGSFESFLVDMGTRPSKAHSLDRYPDNAGDYTPWNCRWATHRDQVRNRRRSWCVKLQGKTMPVAAWCEMIGVDYEGIYEDMLPDEFHDEIGLNFREALLAAVKRDVVDRLVHGPFDQVSLIKTPKPTVPRERTSRVTTIKEAVPI